MEEKDNVLDEEIKEVELDSINTDEESQNSGESEIVENNPVDNTETIDFIKEEESIIEDEKTTEEIDVSLIQSEDVVDKEIDTALYSDSRDTINEKVLTRRERRKEKRKAKLQARYLNPVDIKYRGILSYRHLRIIAWIAIAMSQLLVVNAVSAKILESPLIGDVGAFFVEMVSALSLPLFMIAAFSLILNNNKTNKSTILTYLGLYLAVGCGLLIVYFRYIDVLMKPIMEESGQSVSLAVGDLLGKKAEINVFADLLALSLFYFFVTYTPKKYFKDKKIIIFRLFALLPLIFATVTYILKVLANLGEMSLPFYIYPFLTTKPPVIYLLFIILAIWIKNRKRRFTKIGATEEDYQRYLKTNRNSLSFSGHLSIILLITALVDLLIFFVVFILLTTKYYYIFGALAEIDPAQYEEVELIDVALMAALGETTSYSIGEGASLIIAIPFVMLFSYTKKYENGTFDIMIPLAGIGIVAFTYLESIYQIMLRI